TTVNFPCSGSTVTPAGPATVSATAGISITSPTCNLGGNLTGTATVTVTTPLGSATGQYQFVAPGTPHVTGISPTTGTILGNTSVTVSGSNFIGATKVTFGTVDVAGFQLNSAGSITVNSPPQSAAGSVNVTVTVNNGSTNVTTTETATFTYTLPPPVVNTISPDNGSTAGGTTIKIFGQY